VRRLSRVFQARRKPRPPRKFNPLASLRHASLSGVVAPLFLQIAALCDPLRMVSSGVPFQTSITSVEWSLLRCDFFASSFC
jgi:hypothetical protein